jgi:hypothetical protein
MAEGLSRTIKVAITDHSLLGISLHIISLPISHSQFVDDILMMGLPTVREATRILSVINLFYDASGMDVSLTKSQIFFFNMPIQVKIHINQLPPFQLSWHPSYRQSIKEYLLGRSSVQIQKKTTLLEFLFPQYSWSFNSP